MAATSDKTTVESDSRLGTNLPRAESVSRSLRFWVLDEERKAPPDRAGSLRTVPAGAALGRLINWFGQVVPHGESAADGAAAISRAGSAALTDYRDALLGAQQALAEKEAILARRDREKAELAATVQDIQRACAELRGRLGASEAVNERLEARLGEAHQEIQRQASELEQLRKTADRLGMKIAAQRSANAELRSELAAAESTIAQLRGDLEAAIARGNALARDSEAALAARVRELEAALAEAQSLTAAARADLARQEQVSAELQATLSAERQQGLAGAEALQRAERARVSADEQAALLARDLLQQQGRTRELEAVIRGHEDRAQLREAELGRLRERVESLERALSDREVELRERAADAEDRADALAAIKAELLAMASQREGLKSLLREKDLMIERLNATLAQMEQSQRVLHAESEARGRLIEELANKLRDGRGSAPPAEAVRSAEGGSDSPVVPGQAAGAAVPLGPQALAERPTRRLLLLDNGGQLLRYPLYKHVNTIGRAPDSDICIKGPYASRRHARLVLDDQHAVIEDLNSVNGVMVNDKIVARHELRDGDVIDIGESRFRFVDLDDPGHRPVLRATQP